MANLKKEGETVGEYRIMGFLGRGGMSEVYEAEHIRLGSRHAVKFFTYEGTAASVRERFSSEGRMLAKMRHPRVVRVTDFGEEDGRPYFAMELVTDGEGKVRTLGDVQPGEADEATIGKWYEDLREGLGYIHSKGIIHRDLKLENLLIGPDGHLVITDFGISKVEDAAKAGVTAVNTVASAIEGRNTIMGSIGYMAPEVGMGIEASPVSDYYAVGVIIYRLLTGEWYDEQTRLLDELETYNGGWAEVLPKLLHANPRGREFPPLRLTEEESEANAEALRRAGNAQRRMAIGFAAVLAGVVGYGWMEARERNRTANAVYEAVCTSCEELANEWNAGKTNETDMMTADGFEFEQEEWRKDLIDASIAMLSGNMPKDEFAYRLKNRRDETGKEDAEGVQHWLWERAAKKMGVTK